MKRTQRSLKKVMVFGTFDGLHPGHLYFLEEAKKLGNLFISVSSDTGAKARGKNPAHTAKKRIADIRKLKIAKKIFAGEKMLHEWKSLRDLRPDIIALGYDQKELEKALRKAKKEHGLHFEIVRIKPFNPDTFHSSIIKSKTKS